MADHGEIPSEIPEYHPERMHEMIECKEPHRKTELDMIAELQNGGLLQGFYVNVEIIVQTVNEFEKAAVLSVVSGPEIDERHHPLKPVRLPHKELTVVLGMFAGLKCAVIQTKMGRDSGKEVRIALEECRMAQVILAIGVGWGNPKKVKLGDVLCSKRINAYGNMKMQDGEIWSRSPRTYEMPRELLMVFNATATSWANFVCAKQVAGGGARKSKALVGPMISWETLLDDKETRDAICRTEREAIGGEMEGVQMLEIKEWFADRCIDVVIIKGVADFADGKKDKTWQLTAAMAAAKYTEYCLERRPTGLALFQGSGIQPESTVTSQQLADDSIGNREKQPKYVSGSSIQSERTAASQQVDDPWSGPPSSKRPKNSLLSTAAPGSLSGGTDPVTTGTIWSKTPELNDAYDLIKSKSHQFRKLAIGLKIDENTIEQIQQHSLLGITDPMEACLNKWMESYCSPVTWKQLYDVAVKIQWVNVAKGIEDFVIKNNKNPTYVNRKDFSFM